MRWRIKGRAEERFSLSLAELMLLEEVTRPLPAVRRMPLLLAAYCGLRRGEAMGLQRRDFNRAHSTLKIERNATHGAISTPKTDRSTRTVSVPAFLATEIAAHIDAQKVAALDGADWLLPNKRGRPQYHNVDRWWHRVREDLANRLTDPARAQLLRTKLDIHCLRHIFSTVAQELGAAQATIQQQLGHASATMTRQYTHPSLESQRAAVALFPTPNRCVTAASEFGA